MLSPLDIRKQEFKKALRGYNEEQVDDFLEDVAATLDDILRTQDLLQKKLQQSEQHQQKYHELEDALKSTIVMAQKNAQDLKENTDQEIRVMMLDAQQRAEILLQQAEEEAKQMILQAEEQVKETLETHQELKKQAQVFRAQFRNFLETQLELLAMDAVFKPTQHENDEQSGEIPSECQEQAG